MTKNKRPWILFCRSLLIILGVTCAALSIWFAVDTAQTNMLSVVFLTLGLLLTYKGLRGPDNKIYKWVLGAIASILLAGGSLFGLFALTLSSLSDDMCATHIFDHVISPDGHKQAVLYQIDCGATTGFNRQLSVVASDINLKVQNPPLQTSFFASYGKPNVQFTWLSDSRLEVQYPKGAKVFRTKTKSNGVAIQYKQSD